MEAALLRLQEDNAAHLGIAEHELGDSEQIATAILKLHSVLKAALPLLQSRRVGQLSQRNQSGEKASSDSTTVSLRWLMNKCKSVPSALTPEHLARAIIEASHLDDEAQQQAALFDVLGESEVSMNLLMEVIPSMSDIRQNITISELNTFTTEVEQDQSSFAVSVDIEEERRQFLLREALDAAQMAAIAKAEYEDMTGSGNAGNAVATHTIFRTSQLEAKKFAEKLEKRAAQLMKRAKEAGAVLDDEATNFLAIDRRDSAVGFGEGGLLNRSREELLALQQSLLPEGSRHYYDNRGLPIGAIREVMDGMEKVIIPTPRREEGNLRPRLKISEIITDSELAMAFEGTKSLNPMQSEVFAISFHSRENMLVCAPTGAGKTNVAMLTTISHFRDAGILARGSNNEKDSMEVGKKVVYIAPMKALAQEVVEKFSAKLKPLRLNVRELTGDMQLSRAEAESANVIVTTPEKWDVITRKSGTDEKSLGNQCGLLIIDEVHLLADERGAVIESVVSRLHRLVESRQRQVRIVALSATLPNYDDVADFLKVQEAGLFYFGPEHRPVPLKQTFVGLKVNTRDRNMKERRMNETCFDTVVDSLQRGYQVMVFVHSRKGTWDTASALAEIAVQEGVLEKYFVTAGKEGNIGEAHRRYADRAQKSRNRQVTALFQQGIGLHHAGMIRSDRKLTEQMFNDGAIRVLCCTATLAWGINLPAHTVVIKGTEVYNPEKGGTIDLSILDVQQIFGRAGRPQFDSDGEATLITTHDAFQRYMDKLVRPVPIESNFIKQLADHLNAEVVSGTVSNLSEAARWLTYTYLYVRMLRNPLAYGISADQKNDDPTLRRRCLELVMDAATLLDANKMLRYDKRSGNLGIANNGRVAAHFYIQAQSIATFQDMFRATKYPNDQTLCRIICSANEFQNMKLRQEEMDELQNLIAEACPFPIKGAGLDDAGHGLVAGPIDKAFVLLQAYISRAKIKNFTLISDMNYIASNAARVARGLFEMCLKNENAGSAVKLLRIAKSVESQFWFFQTPLRHFESELREPVLASFDNVAGNNIYDAFENALSLLDMLPGEVGSLCKWNKQGGETVQKFIRMLPRIKLSCRTKPVTGSVLRFTIEIIIDFAWNVRWHGGSQSYWLWVEDSANGKIYHNEHISLSKSNYSEPLILDFSIPMFDSLSTQYLVRAISDAWVGVEQVLPVSLQEITIPTDRTPHTNLLNLTPLAKSALQNPKYEQLFSKFETFNPIQTQLFHVLYHSDSPVLLGAPTGSGKTIVAELAILRMKLLHPRGICVYIAPLKSLARERLKEWQMRLGSAPLHWKVLELSGDTSHDQAILQKADILICTPEKWDLVSRGWNGLLGRNDEFLSKNTAKDFVKRVRLLVLDEVHLLGEERGAVLEAIVSRTRFISRYVHIEQIKKNEKDLENSGIMEATRIIGLSTALANPRDLADWIGIDTTSFGPKALIGLYNFRSSVRPVPTKVHVQGFPGKHYCPRMATMNKPCFAAIKELSPNKPVLIFVASRRQTRLTAFDIISYAASEENPKMFLGCNDTYIESVANIIQDEATRHAISFGIGLHHAGLSSRDREFVEMMFLERKIQILVATATLAWGVNLPAHLVIVKGTEYYDGKISKYVDYPLTDVLQMIGRAGRPGYDTEAQAVVMVEESKKNFYKKFLYTPFPVESCLEHRLCETLNAEVASGTIKSTVEGLGYMTWTFFSRRVRANPSYYGAQSNSDEHVGKLLHEVVKHAFCKLQEAGCIEMSGDLDNAFLSPTTLGIACANFYLVYQTAKQMQLGIREVEKILAECTEEEPNKIAINTPKGLCLVPFDLPVHVDEVSAAWLLYTICSTHEFDEHPVRHNEEFLNEELSHDSIWGPDPSSLMTGKSMQKHTNIETFVDPHTKCFLLVQAYLQRSHLPISDYVNDTKTVVDNIPRLLAAMEFIAAREQRGLRSFELLTVFPRTKQLLKARCLVDDDPLLQLPSFSNSMLRQMQQKSKEENVVFESFHEWRSKTRDQTASCWLPLWRDNKTSASLDHALDVLYQYPLVAVNQASMTMEVEKNTGNCIGKLNLILEVEREMSRNKKNKDNTDDSYSLSILLGSMERRFLLSHDTVRFNRFGKWMVNKELTFEWSLAIADGGKDKGFVILRLLFNEVRGLDSEMVITLR